MSDSTGNARTDCPPRQGFLAYWGRVIARAFCDMCHLMGNDLKKNAVIGLLILLGFLAVGWFSEEAKGWEFTIDMAVWLGKGVLLTFAICVVLFFVYLFRTPWTIENEMVVAQDAKFDALGARIEQLGAAYTAYEIVSEKKLAAAETKIADLVKENARVASLNPHVAILKREVGKFIERYKVALAMLRALKGHGLTLLFKLDEECKEYLGRHVATDRSFFSNYRPVLEFWQQEDENDTPLDAGRAGKYATICNDRLEKLGEILGADS